MKRVLALSAIAVALAGCGGSPSSPQPAAPRVSPASFGTTLSRCRPSVLPAGFAIDKAHSGRLTAHTYSASADVQAALDFDQLQSGSRDVFVHHAAGTHSAIDGVASCVALRFPSAAQAGRFFASYRTLRRQATSIVHEMSPSRSIAGLTGTVTYYERQQSFRGYRIASTNVIETAGLAGQTLFITSVAGTKPSRNLATKLIESMVVQP